MSQPKIYHIHFRKTGGTALRQLLRRAVRPKNPLNAFSDLEFFRDIPEEKWKTILSKTDFISGHFGRLGPMVSADFKRICVFRDPLSRVVSGYNHIKNDVLDPLHAAVADLPLQAAIDDYRFAWELSNHQTRLTVENAGEIFENLTDKERIQCALNFLNDISVVGVLEQPSRLLTLLRANLGVAVPNNLPLTNTEITENGVGKHEIYSCFDQAIQNNRLDIAVYQAVLTGDFRHPSASWKLPRDAAASADLTRRARESDVQAFTPIRGDLKPISNSKEGSPKMAETPFATPSRRSPTPAQVAVNDIAYVDLVDVCNLKCPTCVRGVGVIENSAKKMPLDKFSKIVAKIKSEGFKKIGLSNWTEPFLNRNLHEYVAVIKDHGLICMVSTNFSLRRIDDLEPALKAGIDHLIVTVSGFDQNVYKINHVSGNIEYVKTNLKRAANLKSNGEIKTKIVIRFLKFKYNHEQEEKLAIYARNLGIELEVIAGDGDPVHNRLSGRTNDHYKKIIGEYRSERPFDPPGTVCHLMMGQAVIDSQGNAFQCCAYPTHDSIQIGPYLDLSHEELLLRKLSHPLCATCKFPRRAATPAHRELVMEAMRYRFSAPVQAEERAARDSSHSEGVAVINATNAGSIAPTGHKPHAGAVPVVSANRTVTADDVRLCYRFILGREPESRQAAEAHSVTARSFRALVSQLIASPEYRQRPGGRLQPPPQRAAGNPGVSEDDVVWCYRSILGREPESADAVRTYVATAPNFRSLVLEFLESPEYKMKTGAGAASPQRKETSALPVTDDDVVWCYRFVLGREPESLDAIRTHAAAVPDFRAMLARLITSPEYRQKPGARLLPPPKRAPGNPAVTEDDVVWCYRSLLGREPESLDSIRTLVALAGDFRALVGEFVGTPEYRQKPGARPVLGPDKPASPPASSPAANGDAAEPLPPDRLLDAASPASVVVTAGDDPAALERTLDTFLRRNSFPIRDLIILQSENTKYQALIEKFQKYTFKWLTGDAATAPAAMSAVDATVTAEFIFECEGGWEFTRTGFIEKSLCVLRQNPEVSEVFLGAADAAAGIPLSESVFFADDTPYRLWPTAGDAGDPAAHHPAVFHGPKLRRRRDDRTGTAMAEGEGLARRGTLTAVLADGAGQT